MRLGRHAIIDGARADPFLLNNRPVLKRLLKAACESAGATVLQVMSHHFSPQGVTVACLLAESHATVHTYPECGIYMADVFTCGDVDPELAANVLRRQLGGESSVRVLDRPVEVQ